MSCPKPGNYEESIFNWFEGHSFVPWGCNICQDKLLALVEQLTSVPTCGSSISYICMYLECILKIVGQISNEQKMMEICLRWFGQVRRIPMEASLRSEKSESNWR